MMSKEKIIVNNSGSSVIDNAKATKGKVVSEKYKVLIDHISKFTLLELKGFVEELQKHFDINPSQLVVASANAETKEKKSELLNVIVTEVGKSKIGVIKVVSKLIGKGLLDAKKLLDNVPFVIAEKQTEENANKTKADLVAAGAVVELK